MDGCRQRRVDDHTFQDRQSRFWRDRVTFCPEPLCVCVCEGCSALYNQFLEIVYLFCFVFVRVLS